MHLLGDASILKEGIKMKKIMKKLPLGLAAIMLCGMTVVLCGDDCVGDTSTEVRIDVTTEEATSTEATTAANLSEYDKFREELKNDSGIEFPEDDGSIEVTEFVVMGKNGEEGWAEKESVIGAHLTAGDGYFDKAKQAVTNQLGEPTQQEDGEFGSFVVWGKPSTEVEGTVDEVIMDYNTEDKSIGVKYHKNMPTE